MTTINFQLQDKTAINGMRMDTVYNKTNIQDLTDLTMDNLINAQKQGYTPEEVKTIFLQKSSSL